MTPLKDEQMAGVVGQALFVGDKIAGDPSRGYSRFDYYRMMMDVELGLNANIEKLQLGCGGFNQSIKGGCDIDLQNVSLLGSTTTANGKIIPDDPVSSDFTLLRPYIEFAIENDDSTTQREIVGVKIGSAAADGFFSVGRRLPDNAINPVSGAQCDASATSGGGARACHVGLNQLSAYLGAELSATVDVQTGFGDAYGCFGRTSDPTDACRLTPTAPCQGDCVYDPLFQSYASTRLNDVSKQDIRLNLVDQGGLLGFLGISEAYADLQAQNLRFIHEIGLDSDKTKDFFLSFQRERVAWPIYDQSNPYDTDGTFNGNDTFMGAGGSRFSYPANAGWWMNIPYAAVMDGHASVDLGFNLGDVIDALGEGVDVSHLDLQQNPADNCHGSSIFC